MECISRIIGCLYAGAYGDALGVPFEGASSPRLPSKTDRSWHVSDDTQLTIATCEAIVECDGKVDPSRIAERFAFWYRASRVTGMGASTFKALTELAHGGHWALVGRKGEMAAGNGAAMRIAPVAFCVDPKSDESRTIIRDVARITHHNDEAYAGALAVTVAVRAACDGRWRGDAPLLPLVAEALPDTLVRDRIEEISRLPSDASPADVAHRFGNSGYVVESVPLALHGAQSALSLGLLEALHQLVSCGGDADTIASIAGQIAGARLGDDALPDEVRSRVESLPLVRKVAAEFADTVASRLR